MKMMMDPPIISTRLNSTSIPRKNNSSRGRSASPRVRPWSAADSDKCECVLEVLSHDVLLGRGSGPNDHVGNIQFRDLIHGRKSEYLSTNHRQTKALIAKEIVDQVYQRGGRFLKKLGTSEAAKVLPRLLGDSGLDDSENDTTDFDSPRDVYQVQKHAVVMEKAKQALRQNQRSGGSPSPTSRTTCGESSPTISRRHSPSEGRVKKISPETPPHAVVMNNVNGTSMNNVDSNNFNNWAGMNVNIPTTLNAFSSSGGFQEQQVFQGNNTHNNPAADSFDVLNSGYPSSQQHSNTDAFQQHQGYEHQHQQQGGDPMMRLSHLRQQHQEILLQYEQLNQFQPNQAEQQKQLIQEQLENQLRQEQIRQQLQQQSMHKLENNAALYSSKRRQDREQPQAVQSQQQQCPPEFLNGYATYTTTLDAMECNRQDTDRHDSNTALEEDEEIVDINDKNNGSDSHSMQMSTMMGSFKDMSVRSNESMHNSNDTIGTIDNIPSGVVGGFSMAHMSGISIMSMMNDSTDSLFKGSSRSKDLGAHNASWGNPSESDKLISNSAILKASLGLPRPEVPGSSSKNSSRRSAAAAAGAAALGKNHYGSRADSTGRRHSNNSNSSSSNDANAAASAMLAMASVAEGGNECLGHLQQQHTSNFSFNNRILPNRTALSVHELMNNPSILGPSGIDNNLMGSWQHGAGMQPNMGASSGNMCAPVGLSSGGGDGGNNTPFRSSFATLAANSGSAVGFGVSNNGMNNSRVSSLPTTREGHPSSPP